MNQIFSDVMEALRFWSRLPVPVLPFETDPHAPPDMERLAPVLPLAGAVLGIVGALTLIVVYGAGLSPMPAAIFGVAGTILATGAMHEDGLADVADGFGGGSTVERKLEIMRDPRIGSYGATALMLSIAARISLVGELTYSTGPFRTGLIIIGGLAVSRIAGLLPLVALPPARADGSGAAAGRLTLEKWRIGAVVGFVLAAGLAYVATSHVGSLFAPLFGFLAAYGVTKLAEQQIGGQTGDVCGAATILAEIAFDAAVLATFGL